MINSSQNVPLSHQSAGTQNTGNELNYLLLGELLILVLLVRFVRQGILIHRPRHFYHSGNLDWRFPMSHVGFEKL